MHAEKYDHLFPAQETHNDFNIPCVFEHKKKDSDTQKRNKENFARDGLDNFNNSRPNEERVSSIHAYNPQIKIKNYSNLDPNPNGSARRLDLSRINSNDNLQNPIESFPLTEFTSEDETGTRLVRKRDGPSKTSKQDDFSEV